MDKKISGESDQSGLLNNFLTPQDNPQQNNLPQDEDDKKVHVVAQDQIQEINQLPLMNLLSPLNLSPQENLEMLKKSLSMSKKISKANKKNTPKSKKTEKEKQIDKFGKLSQEASKEMIKVLSSQEKEGTSAINTPESSMESTRAFLMSMVDLIPHGGLMGLLAPSKEKQELLNIFDQILPQEKMLQFAKSTLNGFTCHNEDICLVELVLMKIYEHLRNLKIELSKPKRNFNTQIMLYKTDNLKNIDQQESEDINQALRFLLKVIERVHLMKKEYGNTPAFHENESQLEEQYKTLRILWGDFSENIKKLISIFEIKDNAGKNVVFAVKNFKSCFTFLNTIFINEKNEYEYSPYLFKNLFIFMQANKIEIDTHRPDSLKAGFKHMAEAKNFVMHTLLSSQQALKEGVEIIKNFMFKIKNNQKILVKLLSTESNSGEINYQNLSFYNKELLNSAVALEKHLEDLFRKLLNYDLLLSEGKFGRLLYSYLLSENFKQSIPEEHEIKKQFIQWVEVFKNNSLETIDIQNIKDCIEKFCKNIYDIQILIGTDTSIQMKKQTGLESIDPLISLANALDNYFVCSISSPFTLLDSICTTVQKSFKTHFDFLEEMYNFKNLKAIKENFRFNYGYTIVKVIQNKIDLLCHKNNTEYNHELKNIIDGHLINFRNMLAKVYHHQKEAEPTQLEKLLSVYFNASILTFAQIEESLLKFEIIDREEIQQGLQIPELQLLKQFLVKWGNLAFCTLAESSLFSPLNENEIKELIEVVFPVSVKELETYSSSNIVFSLKKGTLIPTENDFSHYIQRLLGTHLQYLNTLNHLIKKIKNSLVPMDRERWKITKENHDQVFSQLQQLKAVGNTLNAMRDILHLDLEYLKENDCDEILLKICEELKEHVTKGLPCLDGFFMVTVPLIEKWYKQSCKELKKVKKKSKKKKKVSTTATSQKDVEVKNVETKSSSTISEKLLEVSKDKKLKNPIHKEESTKILNVPISTIPNKNESISFHQPLSKVKNEDENPQKPLSNRIEVISENKPRSNDWDKISRKLELYFLLLEIFNLKNNFMRLYEFRKGQKNVQFHFYLINECTYLSVEETPKIIERIFSQSKSLAMEILLKSILSASPLVAQSQTHVLWDCTEEKIPLIRRHQGKKLYSLFDPKVKEESFPLEICEMEEQLNLSVVGPIPQGVKALSKSGKKSTTIFFDKCFDLLKNGYKQQKEIKLMKTVLSSNEKETIECQINIIEFTYPNIKRAKLGNSLSLEECNIIINNISVWEAKQVKVSGAGGYAQKRIQYALELILELIKFPQLKNEKPLLYCAMLSDANNMLICNILHLCLDQFGLLDNKEIKGRLVKHCHQPSQLWDLLKDCIKGDEKLKKRIGRAFENYAFDIRYPYGQNHAGASRLTMLFKLTMEPDEKLLLNLVDAAEDEFYESLNALQYLINQME